MSTYREPGRTVDETEIERAKLHEGAETKRKEIEEKEESRRQLGKLRNAWWEHNGVGVFFILGLLITGSAIVGGKLGWAYMDRRLPPTACKDERLGPMGGAECSHPDQVLEHGNECICRRPPVKP